MSWLSTALWVLPAAAAVLVGLAPAKLWGRSAFAIAAMLANLVLALIAIGQFDSSKGLQFAESREWVSDLGLTYHVGIDGLSLVMVALTAFCVPLATAFGLWAKRENLRGYLALMLALEAAVVLLFVARDLIVVDVGFEAMLVPLIFLIGGWGGTRRVRATIRFVVYTLVGSLLLLVSVITLGLSNGTFDLDGISANTSPWLFLAMIAAFAIKSPLFPFHGWVPEAYREAPPEVAGLLSGVISKAGTYGMIRFALPIFQEPSSDWRWLFVTLALAGLLWCSLMAFRQPDSRGVIAYSSIAQMSLITLGLFVGSGEAYTGSVFQMVNHGLLSMLLFLLAGFVEVRFGETAFARIGSLARGRAALATIVMATGMAALAVPGSSLFASEFLVLLGAFRYWWLVGAIASLAIVLAAMYMLRWISAVLHDRTATPVREGKDVRWEALYLVPLLAVVGFLSVDPHAVTARVDCDSHAGLVAPASTGSEVCK